MVYYAAQILATVEQLHNKKVIYRDLKPENVMLNSDGQARLIDFGFARKVTTDRAFTNCGTLGYTAPEVLKGHGYGFSADLWSFGILVHVLLSG